MQINENHVGHFCSKATAKMSGSTPEEELPANHTGQSYISDTWGRLDLQFEYDRQFLVRETWSK